MIHTNKIEVEMKLDDAGNKHWFIKGTEKLHREDGPAVITLAGLMAWYIDDKLHRKGAPAIIYPDGTYEWWLHGKQLSESEIKKAEERSAKEKAKLKTEKLSALHEDDIFMVMVLGAS